MSNTKEHPNVPHVEPPTPPQIIPNIPPAYQPPTTDRESGERRIEPAQK
jgi:hypothetical protein